MADPDDIPPTVSGSETGSASKKGRGATRMKHLLANRGSNQRLAIDFDHNMNPIGPNAAEFISFVVRLLERSRVFFMTIGNWYRRA